MSIAKHHAEWLSLLEISGPFLSMDVLQKTFPQGLDAVAPELVQTLRAAYEEWADNQGGLAPDPAIHTAWIDFVLATLLEFPDEVLARRQAIPDSIKAVLAEHGETIRPDLMVVDPDSRQPRLLLQIYPAGQDLHKALTGHNWKASPATRMMELLHRTEVPLGLITNGEAWLLVAARPGETTGYAGWYASLWLEERLTLRAFISLLGVARFFGVPDDQTLAALLVESLKDQHEVTDQLGAQVRRAVEILIQAVDRADQDRGRTLLIDLDEAILYEAALTVMMRLVFLLTAEERDLLLLGDPTYDQHYAISTLREQLRQQADQHGEEILERRFDAWSRLLATFRAVYGGIRHENLRLPAYGGSLFDPERFPFLEGRLSVNGQRSTDNGSPITDPLPINNRTVLYLLESLQLLQMKGPGGEYAARRLSFRALDIEQIGHVYEGLLDHEAQRAEQPVLGLNGTQNKEPELAIDQLEAIRANGEEKLIKFLHAETGSSESAVRNRLNADLDNLAQERLRTACGNDEALYRRVLPWAGLLREDVYGWPVVIPAGSVYVTAGTTRRATGTHYTPRSLTEPIVQHTLEPLVYIGPAEGKPREEWQLHSPAQLLDLKVCDMAMGSGAFLVQACRYLSERLVEAWDDVLTQRRRLVLSAVEADAEKSDAPNPQSPFPAPQITPEGRPATGRPDELIIPANDEERLMLARRLVVDRCLYGVDKNHLAVEMAKLSLWLITLDKNRPFTFLDHALRHGDSLIGADEDMFLRWAHGLGDSSMPLFDQEIRRLITEAKEKRQALQSFTVRDVRDAAEKARLLAEAETAMDRIKLGCDLLVGARLLADLKQSEQDALLANALLDYVAREDWQDPVAGRAVKAAKELPAFHWPFEFPEVFAQGGFSAFVGNPPFLGGGRISSFSGNSYFNGLKVTYPMTKGQTDLCAFFFLRAFNNMQKASTLGFIATKTIAQGDTKEAGLEFLLNQGLSIYSANSSMAWPGTATVLISVVHGYNGQFHGQKTLDGKIVSTITSALTDTPLSIKPDSLHSNTNICFSGTKVTGTGFIIEPEEARLLIAKNPDNRKVLFPYLGGQELNSHVKQNATRWIINFFDWPIDIAQQYKGCFKIIEAKVKPEREKSKNKRISEKWWLYERPRLELYKIIESMEQVLVQTVHTKYLVPVFVDAKVV